METDHDSGLKKPIVDSSEDPNGKTTTSKHLLYSEKFEKEPVKILKTDSTNSSRKTFKPPPSSVLSQVKNFLPKMIEANVELQQRLQNEPEELDIENVNEEDCHIEMNLALVENDESDDSELDASDSDLDSDSEENDIHTNDKTEIKISPIINQDTNKNKNVKIEMLDSN
ncbi:hypothetical protein SNE40_008832 [Patella caerulea]|uniref:Uncharacterized protein n=1 Tax=Patella caerulea TaxID=87958 RepID=A0AAN8JMX6_PATCE